MTSSRSCLESRPPNVFERCIEPRWGGGCGGLYFGSFAKETGVIRRTDRRRIILDLVSNRRYKLLLFLAHKAKRSSMAEKCHW